ncbi:hypothetical protein vseg_017576 [Gypsophila vaccaria]
MRRVNDFSDGSSWTTTHTRYRPEIPSVWREDSQFRRDHVTAFHSTRSGTIGADYRPLEERVLLRPARVTRRIPMDSYPRPTRIIIVNNSNNMDYSMNPRLPISVHHFTHRPVSQPIDADESKLTKEQQETVLKSLVRHTYTHVPKTSRRVSLYYRDLNKDVNRRTSGKNTDEDGKICAVCLEDFNDGEDVMLTPCKHMFHEECIVPWVKNHGKCPVCRSGLCDSIRENASAGLSRGRGAAMPAEHGLFSDDILSIIRAVDEAFVIGG